jgi:chromosome segregation protein
MYLKELRINGFKSFADPIRLQLQPGMTAIVGPNGCGKSNIVDAIRWVLGEQSSKSLRADSMAEVIFQGTTNRKPLNLSEVFLLFTDCEAQLGTAYAEVEVGRRVTRDGGSQYFLNGKGCRLRDIQKLFLDTGVGQVSYSFMLQGQIDKILSSNPSERRTIFEEAAGISKYKSQRREALTKLSGVDANLARVTDVIEEVSRQMGSLKRQAGKAIRFKRIRERLSHLELSLKRYRHLTLSNRIFELEKDASVRRSDVKRLREGLEARDALLNEKKQMRTSLAQILQGLQQQVFDVRSQHENALNQAEFAKVRSTDLSERIAKIHHEIIQLEEQKRQLQERIEGEARNKQQQLELFGSSDEVYRSKADELTDVQQRLSAREQALQQQKQQLLEVESSVSRLRSNCTTLEIDQKTFQSRHAALAEDIFLVEQELQVIDKQLSEFQQVLKEHAAEKASLEAEMLVGRESVQVLTQRFRAHQEKIRELDRSIAGMIAQRSVLEDMQLKFEGFSEGTKSILQGRLSDIAPGDRFEVLSASLHIESSSMVAFEVLMGPALDALVCPAWQSVVPFIEALKARKMGKAGFLVDAQCATGSESSALPTGLRPAFSVVQSCAAGIEAHLKRLLQDCYLADDLNSFLTFWNRHPDFPFRLVATPSGELIDARGLIYGGSAHNVRDSRLARQAEIERLTLEQKTREAALLAARGEATLLSESIDQVQETIEVQRRRMLESARETSNCEGQERAARTNHEQLSRRLIQRKQELEMLDDSREVSEQRLAKARAELASVEAKIEAGRQNVSASEEALQSVRAERERLRELFDEIRIEMSNKRQRLELIERGVQELQSKSQEVATLGQRRQLEIQSMERQIDELCAERERFRKLAEDAQSRLQEVYGNLEAVNTQFKAVESALQELDSGMNADRDAFAQQGSALNRLEIELTRLRSDSGHLEQEIEREYAVNLSQINWKLELWRSGVTLSERMRVDIDDENPEDIVEVDAPDPTTEALEALVEPDWAEIDREVQSLRSRLVSMGPVNLVAIEEYRSLKDRYQFLKTQSDDLWQAKDTLLKAIDEINQTSQTLFEQTFEQIRTNFQYTFEALFGGGSSDLALIDNGDVLESGIEITARPPGTRLKSIALLSGGQKTMTAVALLFAIYMVKPSPFCVLDEIDAPLDDANIGRFCHMLQRFLEYSQFLIITHNKRTIAAANSLFGVTMQERGVSRLLSMRFNRDTEQAENLFAASSEGTARSESV